MKEAKGPDLKQCEGFERTGGAFSLGPVVWERCKNKPSYVVVFRRKAEKDCSSCVACLGKLKGYNTQGAYRVLSMKEYRAANKARLESRPCPK